METTAPATAPATAAAPGPFDYDGDAFAWDGPYRQLCLTDDTTAPGPDVVADRLGVFTPVAFFPDGYGAVNGERVPCLHGSTMCPACEGCWYDYTMRTFQEHGPVGYMSGCRCTVCAAAAGDEATLPGVTAAGRLQGALSGPR